MGAWLGEGQGWFVSFQFEPGLEFEVSVRISCDVYVHIRKF